MLEKDKKYLKVGNKVRKEDDNTVWDIVKEIDPEHFEIERYDERGIRETKTLSIRSFGYSLVLNKYRFAAPVIKDVYANSREEAEEIIKKYGIEEHEVNLDSLEFTFIREINEMD